MREVAEREGCAVSLSGAARRRSRLVAARRLASIGITAGASAPEMLVEEIIDAFAERYEVRVETVSAADESVFFPLPRVLREDAQAGARLPAETHQARSAAG